ACAGTVTTVDDMTTYVSGGQRKMRSEKNGACWSRTDGCTRTYTVDNTGPFRLEYEMHSHPHSPRGPTRLHALGRTAVVHVQNLLRGFVPDGSGLVSSVRTGKA